MSEGEKQVRLRLPGACAERLLALPTLDRTAVVERGFACGGATSTAVIPPPSRCELEALGMAITLFRKGAAGGGLVGFRAEQKYLYQYADYAEDLASLCAKLGVSS